MRRPSPIGRSGPVLLVIALAIAACGPSPQPTPSPSGTGTEVPTVATAAPLTPTDVERRLRSLDASLRLAPTTRTDDSGAFPELAFDARTSTPSTDLAPVVGLVLVYPTTADRTAMQPYFGPSGMSGPGASVTWDGVGHSDWIGVDNVIVEVLMPGGTMGGRTPAPDEAGYPDRVRAAMEASR